MLVAPAVPTLNPKSTVPLELIPTNRTLADPLYLVNPPPKITLPVDCFVIAHTSPLKPIPGLNDEDNVAESDTIAIPVAPANL